MLYSIRTTQKLGFRKLETMSNENLKVIFLWVMDL